MTSNFSLVEFLRATARAKGVALNVSRSTVDGSVTLRCVECDGVAAAIPISEQIKARSDAAMVDYIAEVFDAAVGHSCETVGAE